MSSHREAPAISKDPVADNTDTYAFVSPDDPATVTIISNYLPLEAPFGGPNFFEFGDDVRYEIHIDNDADGAPEITYQFQFKTKVRNPDTFLYNTGPINVARQPQAGTGARSTRSRASSTASRNGAGERAGVSRRAISVPRSTPNYAKLAAHGVHTLARRPHGLRRPAARGASMSTSAPSSTSATCGRSRTSTSVPMRRGVTAVDTPPTTSACTRSRIQIPKHER